ncbi:MAG: hypothetical protein JGK26_29230 [Microcoleus sp. PH2017_27_LUM_O_A]|uniref:hypothetical protein n=1 Tax=unclassified Microcoleus TaxID=2642155 RepID=UPI001D3BA207|nr:MULTISPECIES: hypothetical protein [unclassified Microcoleus]MCC3463785.1 hypothetical protein [Microcoleus sp. PH2017_11_PCY_U_A]MCC3482135.1 hypothetical protein [Microcoleus sp. PH2017_12_PCY_D_A]MCC3531549.1 hypothetical protein [Microcoleus sp. PH2017_21_RUC_O_A]MCC3543855.1 hypothetical protein [Microcoleus sp. PH2017_22_RUC_O_B]MCC3563117.1 hypothetical protein [Microcoleus sp. PH2017_27_LUM_O_A]
MKSFSDFAEEKYITQVKADNKSLSAGLRLLENAIETVEGIIEIERALERSHFQLYHWYSGRRNWHQRSRRQHLRQPNQQPRQPNQKPRQPGNSPVGQSSFHVEPACGNCRRFSQCGFIKIA